MMRQPKRMRKVPHQQQPGPHLASRVAGPGPGGNSPAAAAIAGPLHSLDPFAPIILSVVTTVVVLSIEQHGLRTRLLDDWHDPWDHQPKVRVTRAD
jgi:hypothetical protein